MSSPKEPRKSVAFSEGATAVDQNGEVSHEQINGGAKEPSAEAHSTSTILAPEVSSERRSPYLVNGNPTLSDPAVDEVSELFKGLGKKKKKKPVAATDDAAPAADTEFDPTAIKKKKKKAKPETTDDFEAQLAKRGVGAEGEAETNGEKTAEPELVDGDMDAGTGVCQHDEIRAIPFVKLLERFFAHLHSAHPDLMTGGSKSYVIPPPQCLREGNKKTIFANIPDISKRMKRSDEHVTQFIFAELGTSGSVDGSRRLVIKGRFQQKQIEGVLRRYISKSCTLFGV